VIHATWINGRIVPDDPVDLPEGCRLRVEVEPELAESGMIGISEEDWPRSPEAIAEWLDWYDSLEPLVFTPEEEADLMQWRQKVKEYTIANMHKGIESPSG
jgi:predicted DNA-binding antitoxin AbrB/MazE fold protein